MPPPEVLGPLGLTVGAVVAVLVLWREHQKSDADLQRQRDRALSGWESQTAATNRLADVIEARGKHG